MYGEVFAIQAEIYKALAHSRRLEIVNLLRGQELTVSEIFEMLDLPQANISQHLTILREAGLVESRRDGKQIWYKLKSKKIVEAGQKLREFLIEQSEGREIAEEMSMKMKDLVPLVHDPVCQMRLSPKTAEYSQEHRGNNYYFCASGCYKKFVNSPGKYVK